MSGKKDPMDPAGEKGRGIFGQGPRELASRLPRREQ